MHKPRVKRSVYPSVFIVVVSTKIIRFPDLDIRASGISAFKYWKHRKTLDMDHKHYKLCFFIGLAYSLYIILAMHVV